MCFEFDARPPHLPTDLRRPPISGGAPPEIVELVAADGNHFSAALAESPVGSGTGVVILPDVRGLFSFYIELAERFAQAGYHAVSIDYYGRTGGLGPRKREFDFWPHVTETTTDLVHVDTAAAVAALRERTGVTTIVTVGFCFGGIQSFLASAQPELELDGYVGFYAGLATQEQYGFPGPLERVDEISGPLLGLFGGADEGIPVEQISEFDQRLTENEVAHTFEIYAGAPHSFFEEYEQHATACADAWRRGIGFLESVGARAVL